MRARRQGYDFVQLEKREKYRKVKMSSFKTPTKKLTGYGVRALLPVFLTRSLLSAATLSSPKAS